MSDQEKKSGGTGAGGSSVVMVEQSTASRHKPYRPTELHDEASAELHHKRSRAPAVPSVAEELKDSADNTDIKERKECERAMSSEKHKHIVAKKLSSSTKRRGTSPEAIIMAPLEVEIKRAGTITPPSQPIPAQVGPAVSVTSDIAEKTEAEKKGDEDSITEEIAELRTVDPTAKASEWDIENHGQNNVSANQETEKPVPLQRTLASGTINNVGNQTENENDGAEVPENEDSVPLQRKVGSEVVNEIITSTQQLKKKEITWNDATYVEKVKLQDLNARSAAGMLERKASVGPCYRKTIPFGEPSGITICLPKKSLKNCNENINPTKSGITLTISKRLVDNNSRSPNDIEMRNKNDRVGLPKKGKKTDIKIEEEHWDFFGNLKGKLDNLRGKIKHALRM